jgi:multidrug resistance efflux pump
MHVNFEHTLRSLEGRHGLAWWCVPTLGLIVAWSYWLVNARICQYASTPQARIEVNRFPSQVSAQSMGRVTLSNLELGRYVEKGTVLVRLDDAIERDQLRSEEAQLGVLAQKRRNLEQQILAEQSQRESHLRLGNVEAANAQLKVDEARTFAQTQSKLNAIVRSLHEEQLSSTVELVKAEGELSSSEFALRNAARDVERVRAVADYSDKVDLARLAELKKQVVDLDLQRLALEASLSALRVRSEQLVLRAPISGEVGNLIALQVGDTVNAGQVLATLIPPGEVKAVAHYRPQQAIGSIKPGQRARLRFDNFAWTEYGVLDGEVSSVAAEPADNLVRVEVILFNDGQTIPVQHGLTVAIDIKTAEVSPLHLLRRTLGAELFIPSYPSPTPSTSIPVAQRN